MEYAEAVKKVTALKVKDNYLIVEINWDTKLVLPIKEGIILMGCLANAEMLHERSDKQHSISEYKRDAIETKIMSHAEYARIKVAALLGVPPGDLIEVEKSAAST